MDSVNDDAPKCTGFPHSDIVGYSGSYHLTDAFRRLARPSSPLTARASTVYAWSLNLTTRRCFASCCDIERLNTLACVVSIFSLIQIFKEQNVAVRPFRHTLTFLTSMNGGAMRDRTADLLRAKQALSQLSYSPIVGNLIKFAVQIW